MCAYGPWTGGKRGLCPNVNPWISRPAGSPFGSCRIGAGLSSQTAAFRPLSTSRRSGASRARRRTPEQPRHTPGSGYRPRRTVGPPRRRIRPVGSHCGNLGPPNRLLTARSMRVEVIPLTPGAWWEAPGVGCSDRPSAPDGRERVRAGSSVVAGRGHGETSSRRIDLLAVADRDGEVVGLAGGHLFRLLVLELADLDSLLVVEGVNERQVVAGVVGPIVELDEAG